MHFGRLCLVLRHVTSHATLHDTPHNVTIIALVDDELKRLHLAWLVVVGRDLGVLAISVSSGLHKTLPLLFKLCVDVWQPLGRELADEFSQELLLILLQFFCLLLSRACIFFYFFH